MSLILSTFTHPIEFSFLDWVKFASVVFSKFSLCKQQILVLYRYPDCPMAIKWLSYISIARYPWLGKEDGLILLVKKITHSNYNMRSLRRWFSLKPMSKFISPYCNSFTAMAALIHNISHTLVVRHPPLEPLVGKGWPPIYPTRNSSISDQSHTWINSIGVVSLLSEGHHSSCIFKAMSALTFSVPTIVRHSLLEPLLGVNCLTLSYT